MQVYIKFLCIISGCPRKGAHSVFDMRLHSKERELLRIPQQLLEMVLSAGVSKVEFILLCDIMLLIMGMFLEGSSIMLIAAPLMAPVASALDINMIQFGIIMTLGIQVGQMTPPVGLNLFIVAGMQKERVVTVIKGNFAFLLMLVAVWMIASILPGLSTWLPTLMYGAGG